MKRVFIPVILFLGLTTLVGCGKPPAKTGGTATTPAPQPVLPTVHLRASDKGNISQMDVQVILPAGTTKNLLDYNGQATLKGTLSSSTLPCLQGVKSFNCKVQLSVGNIRAQNCSVGGQPISMLIVLLRGQKIKESYSIISIQANAGMSCFLPNTH